MSLNVEHEKFDEVRIQLDDLPHLGHMKERERERQ